MKTELIFSDDRKLFSLFLVAGFGLSAMTLLLFFDENPNEMNDAAAYQSICQNGLCGILENNNQPRFVQQSEVSLTENSQVSRAEKMPDFVSLKKFNSQEPKVFENKVVLFAEKDSFIREGLKNANEGSHEILRVMGTGPTNNRVIISFDQNELETMSAGKLLQSVTLSLFVVDNDGRWDNGNGLAIHKMQTEWMEGKGNTAPIGKILSIENGVNWNCANGALCEDNWNGGLFSLTTSDSKVLTKDSANGYWIQFDVTEDVEGFLAGDSNYGWIIKKIDEDSSGRINFASSENSEKGPQLEMVFLN